MTVLKICGVRRLEDALLAEEYGYWALGFNFYRKSPRYVEPATVKQIGVNLGSKILKIGVFVNAGLEQIQEVIAESGINGIQLHGNEDPDFCAALKEKTDCILIKAFSVKEDFDFQSIQKYPVDYYLLDAYQKNAYGGTGQTFSWDLVPSELNNNPKLILAGGIGPDNMIEARDTLGPFVLDLNSSVEISPGVKNQKLLKEAALKLQSPKEKKSYE